MLPLLSCSRKLRYFLTEEKLSKGGENNSTLEDSIKENFSIQPRSSSKRGRKVAVKIEAASSIDETEDSNVLRRSKRIRGRRAAVIRDSYIDASGDETDPQSEVWLVPCRDIYHYYLTMQLD